jgi:hypothetical protein
MTPEAVGPLLRSVDVRNLPAQAANSDRGDARGMRGPGEGFQDTGHPVAPGRVQAQGRPAPAPGNRKGDRRLDANLRRHPRTFDSTINEEVDVSFSEAAGIPIEPPSDIHAYDPPDEIVNGHVDLGALTAEFLALGLDPYPRKPGVDFAFEGGGPAKESPFAALAKLKESRPGIPS